MRRRCRHVDRLQWGRRNSPAETIQPRQEAGAAPQASMGPPEFTGGNLDDDAMVFLWTTQLQWGRRNSPAETPAPARKLIIVVDCFNGAAGIHRRKRRRPHRLPREGQHASMGPPEFTGGNFIARFTILTRSIGLQWGRRNSPAETMARLLLSATNARCFNGAAGIHRRKRRRGGRYPFSTSLRFNGAAGIHRRKLTSSVCPKPVLSASMGPPEFTGGNMGSAFKDAGRRITASMGPPEFTGGNMGSAFKDAGRRITASMGPPEFTGGNPFGTLTK